MEVESPILRVENLRIGVPRRRGGLLSIVDTADFQLRRHQALGVVGESGSGKTMLCRALMGDAPASRSRGGFRQNPLSGTGFGGGPMRKSGAGSAAGASDTFRRAPWRG